MGLRLFSMPIFCAYLGSKPGRGRRFAKGDLLSVNVAFIVPGNNILVKPEGIEQMDRCKNKL